VRIALAGGTGFTGRRVAGRLAARGETLRCLVRARSDRSALPSGADTVVGDLAEGRAVARWLADCEALAYCASMGFGHVAGVVEAAEQAGVRRAVFVSTTAIFTRLPAPSKAVRLAAEASVRASRLAWTIVRPTMIYGAPGDRNMERLLRALVRWPLLIVPGDGHALIQPVHVEDLADAIVAALDAAAAVGRVYDLSGREPLSFDAAVDAAARAVGRTGRRLHLPLGPVVMALRLVERAGLPLPVRSEQVARVAESKAFSHDHAAKDLGFAPRPFEDGIAEEARLLGLAPGGRP
jgi:nucleoside-diphosphate-sugar epimerase